MNTNYCDPAEDFPFIGFARTRNIYFFLWQAQSKPWNKITVFRNMGCSVLSDFYQLIIYTEILSLNLKFTYLYFTAKELKQQLLVPVTLDPLLFIQTVHWGISCFRIFFIPRILLEARHKVKACFQCYEVLHATDPGRRRETKNTTAV